MIFFLWEEVKMLQIILSTNNKFWNSYYTQLQTFNKYPNIFPGHVQFFKKLKRFKLNTVYNKTKIKILAWIIFAQTIV